MLHKKGDKSYLGGTRILTKEEIAKMSDGSLKAYRRKVRKIRGDIHNVCEGWESPPRPEVVKAADYLWNAIERESEKRKPLP